jgi:hypothetical protein
MRWCPVCGEEMIAEFASTCEDPVGWSCAACGTLQLETGGRPLRAEQLDIVREISRRPSGTAVAERPAGTPVRAAREVVAAFGLSVPVDIGRAARLLGYPVEWVQRPAHERGGISKRGDTASLLLNRDYPFRSEAERRWVIAEEIGHALLGHPALAASDEPGGRVDLREPDRRRQEREAKAFAAELLMPAAEVRAEFKRAEPEVRRALGQRERQEALDRVVTELARSFEVSYTSMRIRLEELGLLH